MRQIRLGLEQGSNLSAYKHLDAGVLKQMRLAVLGKINIVPILQRGMMQSSWKLSGRQWKRELTFLPAQELDSILLKPGRLTNEEFAYMKSHTTRGCEILNNIKDAWDEEYGKVSYEICRYHHERYDGRGYPDGLKEKAFQMIVTGECGVFSPKLLDCFWNARKEFEALAAYAVGEE